MLQFYDLTLKFTTFSDLPCHHAPTGTSETDIKNRRGGLLHFTPMAFRQGNMDGFDAIAMHVAKEIPGGSRVCKSLAI